MRMLPAIKSLRNPFYRHCLTLRDNRKRRKARQFLIDGRIEILRALEAGLEVSAVLVPDCGEMDALIDEMVRSKPSLVIQPMALDLLERLCYGQTGAQPLALAEQPQLCLDQLKIDQHSLVLVLDKIEKPGNLGACLRTAAACGVDAVILTDPICDPFNANVIRASRGAVFGIPMAMATRQEFLCAAGRINLPVYAARVHADRLLWQLPLDRGGAVLFGNETHGLSEDWTSSSVVDFTIPMQYCVDSLNLSISAAVTLFEAVRQRLPDAGRPDPKI